jgi:hypothetical protein
VVTGSNPVAPTILLFRFAGVIRYSLYRNPARLSKSAADSESPQRQAFTV